MKNKGIEVKDKTAIYGIDDGYWHLILMEPRIEFNSIQSCRVKFSGGEIMW